jgi:uncharacterized protein (DUF983 family)
MICPRCDGQGRLYRAILKTNRKVLIICDECEATWSENDEISLENFVDLTTLLKKMGLGYLTSELENINYI